MSRNQNSDGSFRLDVHTNGDDIGEAFAVRNSNKTYAMGAVDESVEADFVPYRYQVGSRLRRALNSIDRRDSTDQKPRMRSSRKTSLLRVYGMGFPRQDKWLYLTQSAGLARSSSSDTVPSNLLTKHRAQHFRKGSSNSVAMNMNDDDTFNSSSKPDAWVTVRTPVHAPLTPVGTPELKPRSAAGSIHKTSSTGKTIDILILPRSAEENKSNGVVSLELPESKPPQITNEEADHIGTTTDSTASVKASLDAAEQPISTEEIDEKMDKSSIDASMAEYEKGMGMTGPEFLKNLPKGVFACPFLQHGCHKVGDEMSVKLHIRDDRMLHLMLLCRAVIELRRLRLEMLVERTEQIMELDDSLTFPMEVVRKFGDQFIFRIKDINHVIQEARGTRNNLLFSEPFETHRYGYKMTVLVAPYGDAEVARQYLSVYVTLIRGDYDAILRWPFTHPMTFIAHATDPVDNLVRKFIPNPIPENLAFLGRPTTRNAAFGIQRFCRLMDVDKYSIEGDFFLSVHVDLSSLDAIRTPRVPADDL